MPLRVLGLFPLLTAAEQNATNLSSFPLALQVAASRAWSRRAMAHARTKIPAEVPHRVRSVKESTRSGSSILTAGSFRYIYFTACVLSDVSNTYSNDHRMTGPKISCNAQDARIERSPTLRSASNDKKAAVLGDKRKQGRVRIPPIDPECTKYEDADITGTVPGYTYFDPVMNNYEPTHTDLISKEASSEDIPWKDLSPYFTTVNVETSAPRNLHLLPIPTSARTLYNNLLHILRTRKPRATLAALIDYHSLFPDHHSAKSYNLLISLSIHNCAYGVTNTLFGAMRRRSIQNNIETHRLYVRWLIYQGFWNRAWSYITRLMNKFPGGVIPFPIWLEFCHTRKGRNPAQKPVQKLPEPSYLFSVRRKIMNTNRPLSIPALKDTPPAAIRNIVQLMVKAKLKHQAHKLTEDYFKVLPLELSKPMNHRCLEIIKVHLVFNGTGKTGLPRFNLAKTLLFSLLSLNSALRPTSDTIMFVLSTLKGAKRCGTNAWKFISLCKEKWGSEVEDRRVQRRVSNMALKEGRMDIVATILQAEALQRRSRQRRLLEIKVVGDVTRPRAKLLRRPSVRRIYPSNGREAQLWRHLRTRIHRKMSKHMAQGGKLIKTPQLPASAENPTNSMSE